MILYFRYGFNIIQRDKSVFVFKVSDLNILPRLVGDRNKSKYI